MSVRRVIVLVVLVATALCVGLVNAGSANAASFGRFYVGGCGMPATPVDICLLYTSDAADDCSIV